MSLRARDTLVLAMTGSIRHTSSRYRFGSHVAVCEHSLNILDSHACIAVAVVTASVDYWAIVDPERRWRILLDDCHSGLFSRRPLANVETL